jgi:hypothetical protein
VLKSWAIAFVLLSSSGVLSAQNAQPTQDADNGTVDAGQDAAPPQVSPHERAKEELKEEERQRIFGVLPNFNTSNIQNAAPLSAGQKFQLAFRGAVDPFQFVVAALDAGYSQWRNDFVGYGRGGQGYSKRFGAAYADQFSGAIWGNAVFPSLLHEDPRYFRKGEGTFKHRLLHSMASTVWTKHDNGTWGPNYANVLGNMAAGGLSNVYYPATDRGMALTFERAATVTAEGAIGAVLEEFWPDINQKLFHPKSKH